MGLKTTALVVSTPIIEKNCQMCHQVALNITTVGLNFHLD